MIIINLILIFLIIYIMCGLGYMVFVIIAEQTFDLGGGYVSNWIAYPIGILFWWIFLYRVLKDRFFMKG